MARSTRLTRDIWIDAGLKALVSDGPAALAAEPMARRMKTTKGSFYWHFKDVPAYQQALVTRWETAAMTALENPEGDTAETGLRYFGHALLADPLEVQMRLWSHSFAPAADALLRVDETRLRFVTALLETLNLKNPAFALAVMGALTGLPQFKPQPKTRAQAFDALIDTILAL